MTIEKWLSDVYYDEWGNCIWNKDKDGSSNMIADIRGWGVLQYEFVSVLEAEKFHDEVGKFIVEAIKEKLAITSSQTEISDEEIRIESMSRFRPVSYQECFEEGAKWYREQLKM
jgi:hypothetical protein